MRPGYIIWLDGEAIGREFWSVKCGCGDYRHGMLTRRACEAWLRVHQKRKHPLSLSGYDRLDSYLALRDAQHAGCEAT